MCFVLLLSPACKMDVIQIGEDEGDALKNSFHQPLECLGCILKPEGRVEKLPKPDGSDDGHFGAFCQGDGNLVVATGYIYF